MAKKKNKKVELETAVPSEADVLAHAEITSIIGDDALALEAEITADLADSDADIELIASDEAEVVAAPETTEESLADVATEGEATDDGTDEATEEATAEFGDAEPRSMTMRELTAPIDSNLVTDMGEIESVLEAIIFSATKAIGLLKIKNLLRSFSYDVSLVAEILEGMIEKTDMRGFQLIKVAGGYQYRSHPKHAEVLQKLLEDRPAKLSPSALEVLSIISYKQPITRTEIDSVRGVDSGHLMKGLLEKNLIRTQGHADTAGRPMLYGTAPYFLEVFGLNSLDDLPALDQMNRELVNDPNGSTSDNETLVLTGDLDLLNDTSGLAANPDRGAFDQPSEEVFDEPDFGETERALEN